jgi:thioredoxin 1
MPYDSQYHDVEPTREEIDQAPGLMVLEFGADWCGHCQAVSPQLEALLARHPHVRHLRIADGRGKPLGRSFRVKLWPTLVFLREGQVLAQLVRPTTKELQETFAQVAAA